MMNEKVAVAVLIACAVAALAFTTHGLSAEQAECGNYAEMRQVWKESDGEYGWPAFDEAKENHCLDQ